MAEAKDKGSQADGQVLYAASKVLAERAIIDFTEKHKGQIGWDATRIVPVWVCNYNIFWSIINVFFFQMFGVRIALLLKGSIWLLLTLPHIIAYHS